MLIVFSQENKLWHKNSNNNIIEKEQYSTVKNIKHSLIVNKKSNNLSLMTPVKYIMVILTFVTIGFIYSFSVKNTYKKVKLKYTSLESYSLQNKTSIERQQVLNNIKNYFENNIILVKNNKDRLWSDMIKGMGQYVDTHLDRRNWTDKVKQKIRIYNNDIVTNAFVCILLSQGDDYFQQIIKSGKLQENAINMYNIFQQQIDNTISLQDIPTHTIFQPYMEDTDYITNMFYKVNGNNHETTTVLDKSDTTTPNIKSSFWTSKFLPWNWFNKHQNTPLVHKQ